MPDIMFRPLYTVTPTTTRALLEINSVRRDLSRIKIPPSILMSLRESAALNSAHFSTRIEGNRLTLPEVAAVRTTGKHIPGKERDTREVSNHFAGHAYMERLAASHGPITATEIQTLHGLVYFGKEKPTPWRNQQNVIRDSGSGRIVYLPPEANDVPALMQDMIDWINVEIAAGSTPVPLIGALAHYQFATIHPYIDGNGRTARLLANLVLHRNGYGLQGIYDLDEHYAENLGGYYGALSVGSHNYYEGRAEADVTGFTDYFLGGMALSFIKIARAAQAGPVASTTSLPSSLLRELDLKQRKVLPFLHVHHSGTTKDLAKALNLSHQSLLILCKKWVETGFLEIENPSRKARSYRLGSRYILPD